VSECTGSSPLTKKTEYLVVFVILFSFGLPHGLKDGHSLRLCKVFFFYYDMFFKVLLFLSIVEKWGLLLSIFL